MFIETKFKKRIKWKQYVRGEIIYVLKTAAYFGLTKKKKKKKKKTAVNGTILPQGMKQRDINSSVLKTCKSRSGL